VKFLENLRQKYPTLRITTEGPDLVEYARDWTRLHETKASAIVWPETAEQVAAILAACNEHDVAVVPSGGRTGLAAGAVATRGEVVLNLERLRTLGECRPELQSIRVGAGVVNEAVQERGRAHGLFWPVELASKGSCHIGGNLATNAGGLRVIRYGHARQWVQSVQVALMDGSLLELNGELEKNNTGYDFRHLLIGSEGTLGVITAATLKLAPLPKPARTLLLALRDIPSAVRAVGIFRRRAWPLLAAEIFSEACLRTVLEVQKFAAPFETPAPAYLLVDVEGTADVSDESLQAGLETLFNEGLVVDGVIASSSEQAKQLWRFRETITESLGSLGIVYKNDLALPLPEMADFLAQLVERAPAWYPGAELYLFGHVGDGNIHVNVLRRDLHPAKSAPEARKAFLDACERANDPLFALVQSKRGSIAAEHGIGLLKKTYLTYSRHPREIEAMRAVKRAFDPKNLLNPGKIFDL